MATGRARRAAPRDSTRAHLRVAPARRVRGARAWALLLAYALRRAAKQEALKVIDFGIAKAATNLSPTRLGVFAGKLAYASPEQLRCERVDRRSDVFSLGVMLFELSVGRRLFPLHNDFSLLKAMTEGEIPRPSDVDQDYPADLERIVMRALARDRNDRYQTARELQVDLEDFAARSALDLSQSAVARLLEDLFRDDIEEWKAAQSAGVTLERHVMTTSTTRTANGDERDGADSDSDEIAMPKDGVRGAARAFSPTVPDGPVSKRSRLLTMRRMVLQDELVTEMAQPTDFAAAGPLDGLSPLSRWKVAEWKSDARSLGFAFVLVTTALSHADRRPKHTPGRPGSRCLRRPWRRWRLWQRPRRLGLEVV